MKRRRRRYGGLALLLAALSFCAVQRRWFTTNDITTGQTPEYPELQSRVYAADLNATRQAAEATCVVIRSHSRVGIGDLGENARHIRALQAAMDARLQTVNPQIDAD